MKPQCGYVGIRRSAKLKLVVGVVLLLVALAALARGLWGQFEFNACARAEPVRMRLDLSRAGEYRAKMHQPFGIGHEEVLELHFSPGFVDGEYFDELLKDFNGRVTIARPDGEIVVCEELRPVDRRSWALERRMAADRLPLLSFLPLETGQYSVVVQVLRPAKALAGRSQELVGAYVLCGCEKMGTNLVMLAGFALLPFGLVLSIIGVLRSRRSRHDPAPTTG